MKKRTKRILTAAIVCILLIAIGLSVFFAIMTARLNQIPNMTFSEMIHYTTENKKEAAITVGVIQNDEISYEVYGENAMPKEHIEHTYEIGSITKTVTATMILKAAEEGKLRLEDSIDKYLALPQKDCYPTVKKLLTHTSGYKNYYFESEMVENFFAGRNDFCGISQEKLFKRIGKINLKDKNYDYEYSNFGFSVLGLLLSEIHGKDYTEFANDFLREDLGLTQTKISNRQGDLGNYWDWKERDAYLSAGGLTSTVGDMLDYARLQLNQTPSYVSETHKKLSDKSGNTAKNEKLNLHADYFAAAWVGDNENEIIWHNGGTGNYNSYIGIDKKNRIAVVILSNLSPSYRIPATVMGIKLLTDLQRKSKTAV